MRTIRRLLPIFIMLAAVFGFAQAFADTGAAATPGWAQTWLIPYVGVIGATLALLQSLVARGQTLTTGFWHTVKGHVLLTAFGAIIGAGLSLIANGNFTPQALYAALASAVTAFGGAWKTTGKAPADGATVTAGPGPTIQKAVLFIPIPLGFILLLSSCIHVTPSEKVFGVAYAACMEGKGLAAAPGVASEAWNDLTTGTNAAAIEGQLEALAGKVGVDAVTCAITSWLSSPVTATADGGTKLTSSAPLNTAGVAAAQAFLKHHQK